MTNQGSGANGQWTFLDVLSLVNFMIGLQNLDMNIDQNDMQDLQRAFNTKIENTVREIHEHLEIQDAKLDEILRRLKDDNS